MSDALSFAELDEQHVELLPGRTVLSLLSLSRGGGTSGHNGSSHNGISVTFGNTSVGPGQTNIAGRGIGGLGGSG
jgi:hypothetical protein